MTLRNAPAMMATVRNQISGGKPNLSQHHDDNKRLSAGPPLLTDGVHSDASPVHLGKREAGAYVGQDSRIQTKQTRLDHPKDTLTLCANDEKKIKKEVIRVLKGFSKSDSMIFMATSILNWSTRAMRIEIYTYYSIHCDDSKLDPLSLAEWFMSKIEEYNSSIHERDTSANVQASLANWKDATEDFLKWLKIPSRTLNGPDTATKKLEATSEKSVAGAVAVSQVGRGAAGHGGSHARPGSGESEPVMNSIKNGLASDKAESSNAVAKRKTAPGERVAGGGDGREVGGGTGGGDGDGGAGDNKFMRGPDGMKDKAGPRRVRRRAFVGARATSCGVRPQGYRVVERALPHLGLGVTVGTDDGKAGREVGAATPSTSSAKQAISAPVAAIVERKVTLRSVPRRVRPHA